MKRHLLTLLIIFHGNLLLGQTSLNEINLNHGDYKVGFKHYTVSDSTRTYSRAYEYTNHKIARPIPVSIWYPSEQKLGNKSPLQVLNYFEILKEEEEWENLPNDQLLNWFYYANTPENQLHLKEQTKAYSEIDFAKGKFPVIIYTASFQASSIENFALCEFLASHGYLVISSPSRGTDTRWFSNNLAMEIETQARDVEFLIKEAGNLAIADYSKIAVMGFSFGGLSNIIAQMRNDRIKAIVSLDGTERYQYELLEKSLSFNLDKMDVPYLHMAQKDIPDIVLKEDKIAPELNSKFVLYDSVRKGQTYRLKFHYLTHSYFSSLGILFSERDPRQDKSDPEIMESYKWVSNYTLNFLNAYLKEDENGMAFLETRPEENTSKEGLISQMVKQGERKVFSFQDFNDLASEQNYENLFQLYSSILKEHPSLKLPEGNLNTIGLQLIFNPKTSQQGINVFQLATKLYPNSANLYDSLAEGYLFLGNNEKAIESFQTSLNLNPNNQNAIIRLEQLKN